MVGQGPSLGISDDVCIIFYPSPFCKPFFPPCTHLAPTPIIAVKNGCGRPPICYHPNPSQWPQGPDCCRSWGQGQWDWRWLWEEVPLSSVQGF